MSDAAHPLIVARSPVADAIARAPGAFYLLTIIAIALTIWTPGFFTSANLTNVALQVAVLMIVALGMTLVILTEGIDLSLGPVLGLCGVSAALLITAGYSLLLSIGAALSSRLQECRPSSSPWAPSASHRASRPSSLTVTR
jgi:ribose transport system permease protein